MVRASDRITKLLHLLNHLTVQPEVRAVLPSEEREVDSEGDSDLQEGEQETIHHTLT